MTTTQQLLALSAAILERRSEVGPEAWPVADASWWAVGNAVNVRLGLPLRPDSVSFEVPRTERSS